MITIGIGNYIGHSSSRNWTKQILVLGNSITIIPEPDGVDWWGAWGMAASVRANDFVHKLETKIRLTRSTTITGVNISAWEAAHTTYDKSNFDAYFTNTPTCVIIRLGENVIDETGLSDSVQGLIDYIKSKVPRAKIIITGTFIYDVSRDEILQNVAAINSIDYVPLGDLYETEYKSAVGETVYDEEGNPHLITSVAVGHHPNDLGMSAIADRIYEKVIPVPVVQRDFITVWNTENAGSPTKTIVIPTSGGGYNFDVDWDNNGTWENFKGIAPATSHVYAAGGEKTIRIRGLFPRIKFSNGGDKLKLTDITQWGTIAWDSFYEAFYGCENLVCTATDYPDTKLVRTFETAFGLCYNFIGDLSGIDTSRAINFVYTFYEARLFNSDVSGWDMRKVTSMNGMLFNAIAFNQDISAWEPLSCADMTMFLANAPFSTANYDALLIAWAELTLQSNVPFKTGAAYSAGAAATARGILTSAPNSWVITDGGQAV